MTNSPMDLPGIEQRVSLRTVAIMLALIFAFTHGWLLLSFDALYWDDWSILTSSPTEIRRMFQFVGFELAGTLNAWLAPFGAGAYKLLLLLSLAIMSVCVFLLAQCYGLKAVQAGWITALFIVAPLNTSKIAAINVLAVVFAAVFFLAWLLLIRDLQKPSLLQRICALTLFSVAFYLPSSLAFFALPAMSIAWHAYRKGRSTRQRFGIFSRRADFLLLPFVQFAIFRLFFFKPHATIANEYQKFGIRSSRLHEAWERIQTDFLLDMPWAVRIVLLALPLLVLLRFAKRPPVQERETIRFADLWIFLGLCACFFALLPYLAVGRLPVFSDWNSRYQLFLPLGFALICWSMGQYLAAYSQRRWVGLSTCALLLMLGAGFSVGSYFEYAKDWKKQNQLIAALQAQTFIKPTDNIVFADSVNYAKRRTLRHYEYSEMIMKAVPAWQGFAVSFAQLQKIGAGSLKTYVGSVGKIEELETMPRIFGLSSQWRWDDNCVVLVVFEVEGRVQLRRAHDLTESQQPCTLPADKAY